MKAINDLILYHNKFDKLIVIIRHSNREHIPNGVHDIITPINDIGKINAQKVGKLLQKFDLKSIYTSPVDRCIQTSKNILIGYNKTFEIKETEMLGEPGTYVFDREIAKNHFIKLSTKTVVEKQIKGEHLEGIREIKEGSNILKQFVIDKLISLNKNELIVFVTHDAILAPFIYSLTGEKFGKNNWVDFLDGIVITKSSYKYYSIRKNQINEIS
jgi:probable phosphoglycerate mutase